METQCVLGSLGAWVTVEGQPSLNTRPQGAQELWYLEQRFSVAKHFHPIIPGNPSPILPSVHCSEGDTEAQTG
jgi:hypothetical protein